MGILEVVLLIAGIVIFIGSFLLPSGKESGINKEAAKEEIKGLMEEEMQTARFSHFTKDFFHLGFLLVVSLF